MTCTAPPLAAVLFPVRDYQFGFTTADIGLSNVTVIPLSDNALGAHKISNKTTHNIVTPPLPERSDQQAPELAYEAFYPRGGLNPGSDTPSGLSMYLSGPSWFKEKAAEAKEIFWSYRVMFESNWEGVLGGKLPGPFGGVGSKAYACSGGRQDDRCQCFSLRLMWRPQMEGEVYAYVPPLASNMARLLAVPPFSTKEGDYGISVGRGAFKLVPGIWTAVCIKIRMNEIGSEDGELALYVDGKRVIHAAGLVFKTKESVDVKMMGMHFQTFFGGSSPPWASPRDQRAWFADISAAIVE